MNECQEWNLRAVWHKISSAKIVLVLMCDVMIFQVDDNLCVLYVRGVYKWYWATN